LARSGVRNARKVFWMRETTTEGRFAEKKFTPGAVASGA